MDIKKRECCCTQRKTKRSLYDFEIKNQSGEVVDLAKFKNKVVLVVNTASKCGFTPQYNGLEKLYEKYVDDGFVILDFPCNQFLAQAPGTSEEIHSACVLRFNTKFPQFEKIKVNGKDAHPLFVYLESQNGEKKVKKIKWNFTKFLIARDGSFLGRFEPTVKPEEIEPEIIKALEK